MKRIKHSTILRWAIQYRLASYDDITHQIARAEAANAELVAQSLLPAVAREKENLDCLYALYAIETGKEFDLKRYRP